MRKATKEQLERWAKGALDKANQVRKALGYPEVDRLYPGTPSDAYTCAITETIYDDDVDRKLYRIMTADSISVVSIHFTPQYYSHSRESRAFIHHFDEGEYPELEK